MQEEKWRVARLQPLPFSLDFRKFVPHFGPLRKYMIREL